jgi:hypothetical protein
MKRTFTTRCYIWDIVRKFHAPRKAGKLSPVICRSEMDKGFAMWADYAYDGRGNRSLNSMIQSLLEMPGHDKDDIDKFGNQQAVNWKRSIMEWTRGIPAGPTPTQPLGSLRQIPFPDALKQG